ncbi:hypothetical protein D7Z26_00315 [Cohnella endophytica]|uniref:DUF4352 domain-containing protein n=1 Tax=Cohnella endophytica TaxID=2419778 RepID=A0A494Y7E2_9BACL|nr:hypothetical protein [Cohnella endophytica]RKP57993.1 hypothetical protein D7Z26_00315 [Cohnella endophytica]
MEVKAPFKFLFSLLIIMIIITGCNTNKPITPNELDKINVEVIDRSEMPVGIAYTIKLSNESNHTIKQNNVFISYAIKTTNGSKGNEFKVEAKDNKLDIKPHEEVLLSAFTPIEELQGNDKIMMDECYLEIKGYVDRVEEVNHFGKTISIRF